MADQFEAGIERLLTALRLLNASIQHLSTYQWTYAFGTDGVEESVAVSGALGSVVINVELIGTIAAAAITSTSPMFVEELTGAIAADTTLTAELDILISFLSSLAETSGADGWLTGVIMPIAGALVSAATVEAPTLSLDLAGFAGSTDGGTTLVVAKLWT